MRRSRVFKAPSFPSSVGIGPASRRAIREKQRIDYKFLRLLTHAYPGLIIFLCKIISGKQFSMFCTHRLACWRLARASSVLRGFRAPVGWDLQAEEQKQNEREKKQKFPDAYNSKRCPASSEIMKFRTHPRAGV
ncbi:unnamed protein product [Ectocarpus fasciculatus]